MKNPWTKKEPFSEHVAQRCKHARQLRASAHDRCREERSLGFLECRARASEASKKEKESPLMWAREESAALRKPFSNVQ
ncbi:hypothetical protein AB3X96_29610 [Paraburkholderia sp. BR13439]|uniref:hypothetical protein n=1 Tax=Paraburkholderia sp. BR13439 TaxID=3236996 RepID=UPI0034CD8B1D